MYAFKPTILEVLVIFQAASQEAAPLYVPCEFQSLRRLGSRKSFPSSPQTLRTPSSEPKLRTFREQFANMFELPSTSNPTRGMDATHPPPMVNYLSRFLSLPLTQLSLPRTHLVITRFSLCDAALKADTAAKPALQEQQLLHLRQTALFPCRLENLVTSPHSCDLRP